MDKKLEFITSSKLFTTVFDEEMKGRGFRRKGHLYYKFVGEFIQGVALKTVNPYSICFHAFPYWSQPGFGREDFDFNKGYWTEDGMEISPENLFGRYYRKENVENNFDAMRVSLELAKEYFLPILESVKDYDSYIAYKSVIWPESYKSVIWPERQNDNMTKHEFYIESFADKYKEEIKNRILFPVVNMYYAGLNAADQYVFLYKAFLDGSFENAYKMLMEKVQKKANKYSGTSIYEQERVKITSFYTSIFVEKMNANDLSWIEEYRLERKKMMIAKIKKELSVIIEDD